MPAAQQSHPQIGDLSQTTLAVIAGGRGERMGLPKSHLRFQQQPILEWLLRRMRWPGPTLLVTAPAVAHPPAADLFDREAIDPVDGLGPLRGLLTALEESFTPIVAVITVDMPMVRAPLLARLVEVLTAQPETRGVMCRVAGQEKCRIEPFPSAFRREAREEIAVRLGAIENSVQALAALPGFLALGAPPEWPASTWTNLNTPAEFAAFDRLLEDPISKANE
ncbi:MAG TPA: NTP transferase domain-containing protein [Candidatus Dormibacteraeota bacterium]|nr:NTP transferase domain-containing protein [Candidatus Dormibacteraeota bacterium]